MFITVIMSEAADIAATQMTRAVVKIVSSSNFNKDDFLAEKLKLSQAFCLLWQDTKSGDVSGRKVSCECNAAATAAALIDLVALGRVEVEVKPNRTLGFRNDLNLLKVINEQPTGTFLDGAVFDKRLKIFNKAAPNKYKPEKVKDVIFEDLWRWTSTNQVSSLALRSLVDLGVLNMKETCLGRRYPIEKPDLQESLKDQIRAVVLDDKEPNSFIFALLVLSRLADAISVDTPILKKYFTKEEYGKAKRKMNTMIGIGWLGLSDSQNSEAKYKVMGNFVE